jgi:hypothetical protein
LTLFKISYEHVLTIYFQIPYACLAKKTKFSSLTVKIQNFFLQKSKNIVVILTWQMVHETGQPDGRSLVHRHLLSFSFDGWPLGGAV